MSDILKDRIKVNSKITLHTSNGFRYKGRVISIDNNFICLFDFVLNREIFLNLNDIKDIKMEDDIDE